jgi:hypothetical protein
MKHKPLIILWTDVGLFVLFVTLATTGSILHWILPPGSGGRPGGHDARKVLLGLSRYEWGEVHFWVAAAMLALIVLHLTLHWGWIRNWCRRLINPICRETSNTVMRGREIRGRS